MNVDVEVTEARAGRRIDHWFAHYSSDHCNPVNQKIHLVAVPAIAWSVIGMLWCVPVPGAWFRPGMWAALAMFLAWMFYYRASRRLGYGMLVLFVVSAWIMRWLQNRFGTPWLLPFAASVFVAAWIAQFVGHRIEGRKPSFLTDLTYLLIGPAWVLAKLYRKLGWSY